MTNRSAHILVASLRGGDVTSQHIFDLVRFLRGQGMDVRVFYEQEAHDLPADMQAAASQTRYEDYHPGDGLTIVCYAGWFHLAERLREATGPTLFWYHGVTSPDLAAPEAARIQVQTDQSRTTLAWHAHLAAASSLLHAQELHRLSGYPLDRIQVVPMTASTNTPGAQADSTRATPLAEVIAAVDRMAQAGPPPGHAADRQPLFDYADIALRGYEVRSSAPLVGRWIAAVRRALTAHVKEAYLDFIVERQVNYNQQLAAEVERLQAEVRRLQAEVDALRRQPHPHQDSEDTTP